MVSDYLRLLRISHWIKNFFVFVPLLFSQHLLNWSYLSEVLLAFFTFSLASSMIYVFNDYFDAEYDRLHPIKKNRPIASGKISKQKAVSIIIVLAVIVILFAVNLNWLFNYTLIAYIVINILYSLKLKDIVILDLFCIASGFILRVLAGAFAIEVYISKWLILTTLFLALFLAVMKRRSELISLTGNNSTRKVLKDYSQTLIDQIAAVIAGGVIICYALYSISERTYQQFGTEYFVFTTIFVVFGIFRYMFLVYKKSKGENPTEVMLTDLPMIINSLLYIFVVTAIIYYK